jgi:hypothetical protein
MSKFVVVRFTDGDFRVYRKRIANKRKLAEYKGTHIKPEAIAENTDKEAMLAMARIAREAFVEEWPNETDLVDRTDIDDRFP